MIVENFHKLYLNVEANYVEQQQRLLNCEQIFDKEEHELLENTNKDAVFVNCTEKEETAVKGSVEKYEQFIEELNNQSQKRTNNILMVQNDEKQQENGKPFYVQHMCMFIYLLTFFQPDASKKQKRNQGVRADFYNFDYYNIMLENFNLTCKLCSKSFKLYEKIKDHYRDTHNQNGYAVCCGKKFFKLSRVKQHCYWHKNPEAFKFVISFS